MITKVPISVSILRQDIIDYGTRRTIWLHAAKSRLRSRLSTMIVPTNWFNRLIQWVRYYTTEEIEQLVKLFIDDVFLSSGKGDKDVSMLEIAINHCFGATMIDIEFDLLAHIRTYWPNDSEAERIVDKWLDNIPEI